MTTCILYDHKPSQVELKSDKVKFNNSTAYLYQCKLTQAYRLNNKRNLKPVHYKLISKI